MPSTELVAALQLAIGPVILISAVGLILLTLNNRLSQSITRARLLCAEHKTTVDEVRRTHMSKQIGVIWRRATLLRMSIEWMVGSALLSCLLVGALFVQAMLGIGSPYAIGMLFVGSLACMVVGLVHFIRDVRQALVALALELGEDHCATRD